jgi:protein TonB
VTSTFSGRTVADSTGATAAAPTPPSTPNPHKLGSGEPPPVVAPAQLTRRVAPDYPQAAVRQGIEGFAEVRFTVTAKGTVSDVSIVESTPPDIFDRAAIDAVRRWRYEPRTVDGQPTETQLQVKLQFKLDSRK